MGSKIIFPPQAIADLDSAVRFIVCDGAVWIWNIIEDRFQSALKELDFYHTSEHLWDVARNLYPQPQQAEDWVKPLLHPLRHGQEAKVLETLESLPETVRQIVSVWMSLACCAAVCHRLEGKGNVFAPDLADFGTRSDAEFIIRSIIDPGPTITEGFTMQIFNMGEGETCSGIPLKETGIAFKLAPANGETVSLPRQLVRGRETSPQSVMPSNFTELLSAQQIAKPSCRRKVGFPDN